ncbi:TETRACYCLINE RESISTANCE PROTEIN CLASS A-LIKE [Salix koriyanagi]|uniref:TETRACYCLINE RESISTANCE PROTEIN CLASS A-LIKE n=1 Tax=Salix koriyanagi TaxID=2511006 RepID=A0A9Q0SKD6_9ROSI|nr:TETRACYCLINE RESISTANCE PROTEIN CLASS A-LIKE [Salix koriyanagi]KAJ6680974.1 TETRACYCLINE RESISTANCE PROTEIN CLASS A-LIKE [Salix koriyanagi]
MAGKLCSPFRLSLAIIPLAILAYSRTRNFFYAYFVVKTLIAMVCDGSVPCLALAYVADNVPEGRRASAFGILSGIASSAFVCGNLSTRFLSTASTFQVSASAAIASLVYMRVFLQDSIIDEQLTAPILTSTGKPKGKGKAYATNEIPSKNGKTFKSAPSMEDMLCLLKSSVTLSQAAVVAFFYSLAEVGLHASLMYYLKARFHFNKDQFADMMVISGIAGDYFTGGSYAYIGSCSRRGKAACSRALFYMCTCVSLQHCVDLLGTLCCCHVLRSVCLFTTMHAEYCV